MKVTKPAKRGASAAKFLKKLPIIGKYGALVSTVMLVFIASVGTYGVSALVSKSFNPLSAIHHAKTIPTTPASTPSSSTADKTKNTPNLSNDNHYTNSAGNTVHSPAYSSDGSVPAGATGLCNDGTYTFSQTRQGTCSSHGGVDIWIGTPPSTSTATPEPTCNESLKDSYTSLYNADVNAENIKHQGNLNNIEDYANQHGLLFSGYVTDQDNIENQRHQTALTQLLDTYDIQLATIHCL